jgi:hypothetical protein
LLKGPVVTCFELAVPDTAGKLIGLNLLAVYYLKLIDLLHRLKRFRTRKPSSNKGNGMEVRRSDINFMVSCLKNKDHEEGYSCQHRELKLYFTEHGLTWANLYHEYEVEAKRANVRCLALSTWTKLRPKVASQFALNRLQEDCCDVCTK